MKNWTNLKEKVQEMNKFKKKKYKNWKNLNRKSSRTEQI